jgi:hypothetical protein
MHHAIHKITTCLALLFALNCNVKAQVFDEIGYGPELVFNAPISEPGIGVRSHMHFQRYFFLAPQITYFPGIVNIHELYAGASINLKLLPDNNWSFYATGGAYYNMYINYASSANTLAKLHNFDLEGGGGITKNFGCYRPFLEYRVNSKWLESNFRLGVMFYFGDCKGKTKQICPAFTRL